MKSHHSILVAMIEHEHSAFGNEDNPYVLVSEHGIDAVTTKSLIIWDAARFADSVKIYRRMAHRWWIHAAKYPENEHVKAVQKIFHGAISEGMSKDYAEKMAFSRPIGKINTLLEMKVMYSYHDLKTEFPSESDLAIYHRVYRKLRKEGAKSPSNVKRIHQQAKDRYIF